MAAIMLAGAAVVSGACTSDREPLPSAPRFAVSTSPSATSINTLITALFPPPGLLTAARSQFTNIQRVLAQGNIVDARAKTLALIDFASQKFLNNQLIGKQSSATRDLLLQLINALYSFVGLSDGTDVAVALVGPAGGTVVTGTQFAGVNFPSGALPQNVIVTITRDPNQTDPLPTTLDQFPLFYSFKTFPDVPQFGVPAIVGVCVLDELVPEGRGPFLRLAHPLHTDPSTLEILPLASAPFLDCTGAGLEIGARKSARADLASAARAVAGDLFWVMMGAPRDLQASESRRMMMPGGLGGGTKSFSTFGAVDVGGTFVPYQASGYRYLQLGPGVTPPEGFASPTFDDSGEPWATGTAAFGSGGECPINSTIHTTWPAADAEDVTGNPEKYTSILLRKRFTLPAGLERLTIGVAVDNDVQVFVNGVDVTASGGETDADGFLEHENCATTDSFVLSAPGELLHAGTNLIVVRARDRGVESFIDIRVNGAVPEE